MKRSGWREVGGWALLIFPSQRIWPGGTIHTLKFQFSHTFHSLSTSNLSIIMECGSEDCSLCVCVCVCVCAHFCPLCSAKTCLVPTIKAPFTTCSHPSFLNLTFSPPPPPPPPTPFSSQRVTAPKWVKLSEILLQGLGVWWMSVDPDLPPGLQEKVLASRAIR